MALPDSTQFSISFDKVSFQYIPRELADRGCNFDISTHKSFKVTDITLQVKPGERVLLCAGNGQGKSTLLSLIAGKRMPASGTAKVLGRDSFHDTALQKEVALIGAPWPAQALFSCDVARIVTPCDDEPRRDALARALHIPMKAQLNKMSSGQKRRVQLLHGLMTSKSVILMDECSTDIDVAERVTLMDYVAKECEKGACCIYATHILDGVESWATRIVMMDGGRIVRDEPFTPASPTVSLTERNILERKISSYLIALDEAKQQKDTTNTSTSAVVKHHNNGSFTIPESVTAKKASAAAAAAAASATGDKNEEDGNEKQDQLCGEIVAKNFTFRDLFENITHTIPRGKRVLMVSCNGSGKTTVLEMLAGHTFFANKDNQLTVAGRPAFQDTKLHNTIAFGGHWWVQVPPGQMHVHEMLPTPLDARAEYLRALLNVDLAWDVRHVSTGELKRVQILMKMAEFRPVVLMDESTADLDIHMRANLLRFLYEESELRGVTIIYATHIFEGLGEWPSDVLVLSRITRSWLHFPTEKGLVPVTANDGQEDTKVPLRKFLVDTLCALKQTELWEQWYV